MLISLMLAASLMGLGGAPHCAAMCGAACAVFFPRGVPVWSLVGRCLSYAILGGVAAASAGLASSWGRQFSFLQPFWVMAQASAFALGLWLLFTGRMPALLEQWGQDAFHGARQHWRDRTSARPPWMRQGWVTSLLGGMAWALLPCGLLYAAVMTAALAPHPWGGALVMLCFALPGALGVWSAPALLARLRGRRPEVVNAATPVPVIWMRPADADATDMPRATDCKVSAADRVSGQLVGQIAGQFSGTRAAPSLDTSDVRWAVRLSGGMLAAMSAWGAYHLVLAQWQAWCA